jgi:hypothetical protein
LATRLDRPRSQLLRDVENLGGFTIDVEGDSIRVV